MAEMISVSPFRCRMWDGHERIESQINEQTCQSEIESIAKHGQRLPVLGRPIRSDINHDIELIYGARRLFVARHINVPLLVEVREITDREAIIALDIENRQRMELSPYEQGRSFSAWLRAGLFESQDELAHVLHISPSQVSRLLKLTHLPAVILNAFGNPTQVCENWGRDLLELWNDEENRSFVTRTARAIAKEAPRPSATTIYKRLICAPDGLLKKRAAESTHDEVVRDDSGKALFRVSFRTKDIALLVPIECLSTAILGEIKERITTILQYARAQDPELAPDCIKRISVPPKPKVPIWSTVRGKSRIALSAGGAVRNRGRTDALTTSGRPGSDPTESRDLRSRGSLT